MSNYVNPYILKTSLKEYIERLMWASMNISLQRVLELTVFSRAKVLTAKETIPERKIKMVSFLEAPLDIFERKQELILTTGLGFQNDRNIFKKFVEELIEAGAEALVIACGNYVKEIPEEILMIAEKAGFPIIESPWEVRFGEISQAVLEEISKQSHLLDEQSKEMQTELLRIFLQDRSLADGLKVISQYLHLPLAIIDHEGKIMAVNAQNKELENEWHAFRQSLPGPFSSKTLNRRNIAEEVHPALYHLKGSSLYLMPIQSFRGSYQGYLLLDSGDEPLASFMSRKTELLLDYAATSLALWFQRTNTIIKAETAFRADFVLELATKQPDSWDVAARQAESMGYDVEKPYVCMVGLLKNVNDLVKKQGANHDAANDLRHRTLLSLENQINNTATIYRKKAMYTYYQDKFIIYLEPQEKSGDIDKGIHAFLDLAEEKLQHILPGVDIVWGIDDEPKVKNFQKSFHNAQAALNIGLQQKDERKRFTITNVSLYKVLLTLQDSPDVEKLIAATIGKLVKHDKEKNAELVKTLSSYIENLGNISQTARELYIHRQSLLYRITQIEKITGLSLRHSDDFLTLSLSLKFWTMGTKNEAVH